MIALSAQSDPRFALFDEHRELLLAVAYRMLGTVADAEDMVQETFLRWQQACTAEINSPRAFLITIITRLCINHLSSARVQREQYVGQWLPEPFITEPAVNSLDRLVLKESLSFAFMVLMERLSPVERAVFLLREVFDYDYAEIARMLDQSETNCRQIFRRARQHVATARTRFKVMNSKHRELLARFVRASSSGDAEELIALLEADVVLYSDGGGKSFALPNPVHGSQSVARAIVQGGARFRPTEPVVTCNVEVNGAPGVVAYLNGRPLYVLSIETHHDLVGTIYFITNPDKLSHIPRLA